MSSLLTSKQSTFTSDLGSFRVTSIFSNRASKLSPVDMFPGIGKVPFIPEQNKIKNKRKKNKKEEEHAQKRSRAAQAGLGRAPCGLPSVRESLRRGGLLLLLLPLPGAPQRRAAAGFLSLPPLLGPRCLSSRILPAGEGALRASVAVLAAAASSSSSSFSSSSSSSSLSSSSPRSSSSSRRRVGASVLRAAALPPRHRHHHHHHQREGRCRKPRACRE